jgi:hypothetical protein
MPGERLDTAAIFEQVFSTYRSQARLLLPVAFVVAFVPAALSVPHGVTAQALSLAFSLIATVWYQGIVVLAVQDIQDGVRDLGVGALFREVAPVFGPLLWTALLVGLGFLCGLALFIIPALVLLTWWSVAAPVVVIERPDPVSALRRSRALVKGYGWQVFGVVITTLLIVVVVRAAFVGIAAGISDTNLAIALGGFTALVLTAPLFALASAVLYLNLRRPT